MISIQSFTTTSHTRLDKPLGTTTSTRPSFLRSLSGSLLHKRQRCNKMTMRLVPIGGVLDWDEYGDESLSSIVMACYDADALSFQTVCKVEISCTDEMRMALEELCDYTRPSKDASYDVIDEQAFDVWFDPVQVWEIEADVDDLVQNDGYSAAALKNGNVGVGFEKAVKFVRACCDQDVDEATSSDDVFKAFTR